MSHPSKAVLIDVDYRQNLRPITPAQSTRYSKSGRAALSHRRIPAGLYSQQGEPAPGYLSQGWAPYIQPEGQLYFFNCESHVVTEAYIYSPETLKRISHWITVIQDLCQSSGIKLSSSHEVFLQLENDNDEELCSYYLVDHTTCSAFWLHDVCTKELCIPETVSFSQLRWTSKEHYWTHVEYFPSHTVGVPMKFARELLSILTHARADHLTSSVGTFPYTASQCKDFIKLLRDHVSDSEEQLKDVHLICVVARLWAQVARHRFMNYYGEENARLSRDQRMVTAAPRQAPFLVALLTRMLLFNIPRSISENLDSIWIDGLVYADAWAQLMSSTLSNWRETSLWTLGLIFVHSLFYISALGSRPIAVAALALSSVGLITGFVLSHSHQMSMTFEITDAADYLQQNCHPVFGFAPLSMVYSLPRALLYWSIGLMAFQTGFTMFHIADSNVTIAVAGIAFVTTCSLAAVLSRGFDGSYFRSCFLISSCTRLFRCCGKSDDDLERNHQNEDEEP